MFDIFGDHHNITAVKNITRQPFSNENMGKMVSAGPIKPNQPMKKAGEPKKSFLSNTGKTFQNTPARKVFSPRAANIASSIYTDDVDGHKIVKIEFTKPTYRYDMYKELCDFLLSEPHLERHDVSPPSTPPPKIRSPSLVLDSTYHNEFFTDDFSTDDPSDNVLGLPALY